MNAMCAIAEDALTVMRHCFGPIPIRPAISFSSERI